MSYYNFSKNLVLIITLMQLASFDLCRASDSSYESDDNSEYQEEEQEDGTQDDEDDDQTAAAVTPAQKVTCLWKECQDKKRNFKTLKRLYEHVRDTHAVEHDKNHYKCYWKGCNYAYKGDRHAHRHFVSHCDSTHIKYGAIRCKECDTKVYYIENLSSHKKRCPGKPLDKPGTGEDGFECKWKGCTSGKSKAIKDGKSLYKHLQKEHIPQTRGTIVKKCLWRDCEFEPNIRARAMPSVHREAVLCHCAKEHADFRPFECPIVGCDMAFYSQKTQKQHITLCPKAKSSSLRTDKISVSLESEETSVDSGEDTPSDFEGIDGAIKNGRRSPRIIKKRKYEGRAPNPRPGKQARSSRPDQGDDSYAVMAELQPHEAEELYASFALDIPVEDSVLPVPTAIDDMPAPLALEALPVDPPLPLTPEPDEPVPLTPEPDEPPTGVPIPLAQKAHAVDETLESAFEIPEAEATPLPSPVPPLVQPAPQQEFHDTATSRGYYYSYLDEYFSAPSYQAPHQQAPPANYTHIAPPMVDQPTIHVCTWGGMEKCGAQFTSQEQFLQHIQQAHLLMCRFNNCGQGPYPNEESLIQHLQRQHGCW